MRKDGTRVRRAHVRLAADRPARPADRLDDLDDQHHRGQAHPRPAVGLARALHHRARGAGRRGVGARRCSRASCCSPTARTGCGSAPTRAATRCWPAASPALPCLARRRRRCGRRPVGGLPTQELTEAGSDPREVFVESLQQVVRRALALPAMDRRPPGADADRHRHHARAATPRTLAAQQAEKAQVTSRLVTMGEMASSVAHELNQPLTAITNYCNGMVSRVEDDAIDKRRPDRGAARRPRARRSAPARSSTASAPS